MARPLALKQGVTNTRNQPRRNLSFPTTKGWNYMMLDFVNPADGPECGTYTAATDTKSNGWLVTTVGTGNATIGTGADGVLFAFTDFSDESMSYKLFTTGNGAADSLSAGVSNAAGNAFAQSMGHKAGKKAMVGVRLAVAENGGGLVPTMQIGLVSAPADPFVVGTQQPGLVLRIAGGTKTANGTWYYGNPAPVSAAAGSITGSDAIGPKYPFVSFEAYWDGAGTLRTYRNGVQVATVTTSSSKIMGSIATANGLCPVLSFLNTSAVNRVTGVDWFYCAVER